MENCLEHICKPEARIMKVFRVSNSKSFTLQYPCDDRTGTVVCKILDYSSPRGYSFTDLDGVESKVMQPNLNPSASADGSGSN